jgi:hypothetical protein
MTIDLNEAGPLRHFGLIPSGTIVSVQMTIRPGGAGENGWLKRSADGGSEAIDAEFTIVDNEEYAGRKVWQLMLLNGTTDGHAKAAEISRSSLRAIVESARNIRPDDNSEAAQQKRRVNLADFCGLCFIAKVTIEKSRDPAYPDKNRLQPVTPDMRGWHAVEQVPVLTQPGGVSVAAPQQAAASSKPAQAITRPAWAQG